MSVRRRRFAAPIALAGLLVGVVAGCGGSGAPPAATLSPSPSASSVAPSAVPSAEASPSADADAGAALDAFKAFVQTEQSFHAQGDLRLTIGSRTVHVDARSDIAEGDEHAHLSVTTGGAGIRMEIILLDGKAWGKIAQREWQEIPVEGTATNPLASLAIDGLEPAGRANVGGQLAHRFRTEDPDVFATSGVAGTSLSELTIDAGSFEVYVTDDGAPLTAIMTFSGSGTFEGARQDVDAELRYDFSKFGEPVVIEAPI
jgi:hypothetical protein